jgi:hypothetical protein
MIDVIEIGENKIVGFFFGEIVFCPKTYLRSPKIGQNIGKGR